MSFRLALDLTVRHGFWGERPPPLAVVAAEPAALAKAGIVLKPSAGRLLVAVPGEVDAPARITLDIRSEDPRLPGLTEGWEAGWVPVIEVAEDAAEATFPAGPAGRLPRGPGDTRLCRLDVPVSSAETRLRLSVASVRALWAYHVVGRGAQGPLRIVDPDLRHAFEDLGCTTLPDGRSARLLRSVEPMPLAARPGLRLRLEEEQPSPYDPLPLVPVLPAGGTNLRAAPGGQPPGILQSDIFVCLW